MNKCVCLMPSSQYKAKSLYEHVNNVESIDSSIFKGACIGCNLSLTECYKERINKYTYQDIILACSDKEYYEYYKWNIEHNRNIVIKRIGNVLPKPPDYLSTDLDFVETGRSCRNGVGGFGKGGYGYKWNVTKADLDNGWIHLVFYIHFDTKLAKDNFTKWWYSDKKGESLASKALSGTPVATCSSLVSYAIPQLDWEHISDTDLWKERKYDEAVLSEMGLKYDSSIDAIITV